MSYHLKKPIGLTIGKSRCWFIHHQDPALVEKSARNLNLLLFSDRQTGRALIRAKPGSESIQHPLGLAIHLGGVFYESEPA